MSHVCGLVITSYNGLALVGCGLHSRLPKMSFAVRIGLINIQGKDQDVAETFNSLSGHSRMRLSTRQAGHGSTSTYGDFDKTPVSQSICPCGDTAVISQWFPVHRISKSNFSLCSGFLATYGALANVVSWIAAFGFVHSIDG